jgi:cytochrome c2
MKLRAAAAIAWAWLAWGCDGQRARQSAELLTGGDAARGRAAIRLRGCGSCHQIPGVAGANGVVGPPLAGFAERIYIGGQMLNQPENLATWIRAPHSVEPDTVMPETGVTPGEALDIAAFLYTLRR